MQNNSANLGDEKYQLDYMSWDLLASFWTYEILYIVNWKNKDEIVL